MTAVSVLIVDDQDVLRASLATLLAVNPQIEVTHDVGDGWAAVDVVRAHRVDVVLMDIRMPGLDGVSATKEITRISPSTRVLILTTFDADELVIAAIQAGASGYLTKDTRPDTLRQAVLDVAAGTSALAAGVAAKIIGFLRQAPAPEPEALAALTPRESEIFRLMAAGRSNREIGATLYLTQNTVKTHVRAILMKLDLRDRVHAVIYAYEKGLVDQAYRTG